MNDSILLTIKKLLGLDANYTPFDTDVIININAILSVLNQLGVGNSTRITDETTTWNDFLGDHVVSLDEVITYVFLRVQMIFDPPTSNLVGEAKKEMINELGWRLNVKVDPESDSASDAKASLKDELKSYTQEAISEMGIKEDLKSYTREAITETLNSITGE